MPTSMKHQHPKIWRASPDLAVKKFRRAAAGRDMGLRYILAQHWKH
jgi:hypothetical protein